MCRTLLLLRRRNFNRDLKNKLSSNTIITKLINLELAIGGTGLSIARETRRDLMDSEHVALNKSKSMYS